ncbi:MAG: hypothetical protein UX38_C0013G0006 [Microgenomates group bacterium GW2011_GWC1_46_16]|nr:MAG: hypothetical protein UX38_C0013G0006 [Microgenomates group bacterium GW2011_GWC1_46_16]
MGNNIKKEKIKYKVDNCPVCDNSPKKVFICGTGRCASWGNGWKRHWYDKEGICYRCGISKKEANQ